MNKEEIIQIFLDKDYLVSPDFLDSFDGDNGFLKQLTDKKDLVVLNKDLFLVLKHRGKLPDVSWVEFDKSRAIMEKGKNTKIYETFLDILSYSINPEKKSELNKVVSEVKKPEPTVVIEKKSFFPNVIVAQTVNQGDKKKDVADFVQHFKVRYEALRNILIDRQELQNTLSINRILKKRDHAVVSIIGLVQDKKETKNGHILLALEDPTGVITVMISKNKEELHRLARNIVLDEVIGILGNSNGDIVFCNRICFPDVPITKEAKKCKDDVLVGFISDIHVGSDKFLKKEFLRFIGWINGKVGNKEERAKALRVKYLFVVGDLVHGVGVYPDQEKDTIIKDIYEQYSELARYFFMIRKDIRIIMAPGDHDATQLSHPQPPVSKQIAKDLWNIPNLIFVTNPANVTIHASEHFPGFDVLLYHGHGFHYFIDASEELRKSDTPHNPHHIMKYLLQKRHLAPTHASTIYIPGDKEDPLAILKIPDIFVASHLHNPAHSEYNNVITINTSCWQSITDFEVKVGNFPDPCKVPLLNLKTRKVEVLDFNEK